MERYTKYFYIAIDIEEKNSKYAYVRKVSENDNIYSILAGIPGIRAANICYSGRAAKDIVNAWNEQYKKEGKYKFEKPF